MEYVFVQIVWLNFDQCTFDKAIFVSSNVNVMRSYIKKWRKKNLPETNTHSSKFLLGWNRSSIPFPGLNLYFAGANFASR